MGSQKNRLIETVLLSTHNIRFGLEIKLFFCYALLTKVLELSVDDLHEISRLNGPVREATKVEHYRLI